MPDITLRVENYILSRVEGYILRSRLSLSKGRVEGYILSCAEGLCNLHPMTLRSRHD